ncbi:MAG: 5'-nucleotidase C-terminal domain-containing protein [Bacteroidaceae bacterium]|nr:5'-nucleotidase C-terminal domain-containing protein [Bacteroidaceae bacterium]
MRIAYTIISLFCFLSMTNAQVKTVSLKFVETSDVHGVYFPYDFINNRPCDGSLARIYGYLQQQRKVYDDNLIYVDNGDIVQGQPTSYYFNYIDTLAPHVTPQMLNYMGCVAGTFGNHDIEAGHAVYDKLVRESKFPMLAANMINTKTGKPYVKPYEIIVRDGVRIAVLGMITPAIPSWLPENLWSGIKFADMEETARKWIPVLKNKEKADVIVGLFHAGREGGIVTNEYKEDATLDIAKNVPGFDIIFFGHDHTRHSSVVKNCNGDEVVCINPANNARYVSEVVVDLTIKKGKVVSKSAKGQLVDVSKISLDDENVKSFMAKFKKQYDAISAFVNERIGTFDCTIETKDSYFGPSAFMDFLNELQMEIVGADISLSAPLSFNAVISKGDVHMSDMFNLYKYENLLYLMRLTGREIKNHLEMSYALWTNQMKSADDHILLFGDTKNDAQRLGFKNLSFNFDCALGIRYTVDVTKPEGEKVNIISMADGTPFDLDKDYKVAVNSYRGNGGGELLTKGAGIPHEELKNRIIKSTDRDLRYYLMDYIKKHGHISPKCHHLWKFVPEEWAVPASQRDAKLLFGTSK